MNKKKQRENKMKTFDEFYNKIKKIRRKERKETFLPILEGKIQGWNSGFVKGICADNFFITNTIVNLKSVGL